MSVLVGKKAPVFRAKAVINGNDITEDFSLDQYLGNKYVVFFFYPADFTFVCPTELIAFQNKIAEFESRDTVLVAASTDSAFSHWKWLQTPLNDGGIKGVKYPIVADHDKTISMAYDVLAGAYIENTGGDLVFGGSPEAYRGLFLIDKQGTVRHQVVNDMPLGRSVDEILRVIDALQFTEENGEVCPADWKKGEKALTATQEGIASYLSNSNGK
ncbi:MAG: peroxiredoxin [Bacteroidales bacterium]|jgi:peroxiredoxin (alkyl hydroperoxide reductase subunit C)|nr:peroxiredoxin [Bacteroidales bacterium]